MKLIMSVNVTNGFGAMAAVLPERLDAAVRDAAFHVEARAKLRAPVDTGALKASIYTNTSKNSDYVKNMTEAKSQATSKKTGQVRTKPLDLFPERRAPKLMEAIVSVGVQYGGPVEFGLGRGDAQPYLRPAMEDARPRFEKYVAAVLRNSR